MSFLTERVVRAALPLSRGMVVQAPRVFSTSPSLRKTPTESVKEGLKSVDRAVTDNVVLPGLDAAASAGSKIKKGTEKITKGKKGKVEELKGEAQGKMEELKGEAQGKTEEVKGEVKGAAAETRGKAKGAAEEMKNKL
ncbi:hypothetical protein E4U42_002461 [Claviceps africana]|uniref:LEA domain protein n=1 Tax=Claviceps africana TaxID=83212 RepID=A0A8K0NLS7_9HYPO|nr:hypothetical protein E4U42_002461 [Claviceps africana]